MEFSQKVLSFFIFSEKIKTNKGFEEEMKLEGRTPPKLQGKIQTQPLCRRLDDHFFLFQLVYGGVGMQRFVSVKIYETSLCMMSVIVHFE